MKNYTFRTPAEASLSIHQRKKMPAIRQALVCLMLLVSAHAQAQYLHTSGKKIVDKNNEEVILRGMGLGGWMLQEGYMLETNSFANPQHQIRNKISELIGEENTKQFYEAWRANHCTRRDIDSLASWGFNSVRLPMHYNLYTLPIQDEPVAGQNTWLEKGFAITDSLLKWCAQNNMYLILDLHAAPGGQGNDAAISDYDNTKPSLWQSDANKQKTIALWRKLAERYANEPWIGGYDLINEPNWNFTAGENQNGCSETTNTPLRELYIAITHAIREVDQHHIIFIEGNCWGNNYSGIFPVWDTNIAASFHKYWNYNDQGALQFALTMRDQQNIPVWLGESGENSNTWFTNAIQLVETNKIGWAWWPMKKVGSVVNPLTVVRNDGYATLLNYWKNGGAKPAVDFAKSALMQLTEDLKIQNNIYRKDVIDAMFRQVSSKTAIPYAANKIPGVIQASDFDLGRHGVAYADTDTANYQVSTGSYSPWNSGYSYRNDGVDIQPSGDTDNKSNGYNIGWTMDGEWLQYTVHVDSSAAYNIAVRYASSATAASIAVALNGDDITGAVSLPATGGPQTWATKVFENVILYKGTQKLRILIKKGGANLGFFNFTLSEKITETPFVAVSAKTSADGETLYLTLNKKSNPSTVTGTTGFSCTVNGQEATITSLQPDPDNSSRLRLNIDQALADNDVITLRYQAGPVKATDATALENFNALSVQNNLPFHFAIPTKIEAEAFVVNNGLQLEPTTDTGGGQNIGYTTAGDYLEYYIRVPEAGNYSVEVRVACNSQAGKIELQQLTKAGALLNSATINVPVTGGWQTWKTITTAMTLHEGSGILKVKILQPEFNINWFRFSKTIINGTKDNRQGSLNIYPNPTHNRLTLEIPEAGLTKKNTLCIRNMNGSIVKRTDHINSHEMNDIHLGDLPQGLYIIELNLNGKLWSNKFIVK
jgi:endoglucanase